MKKLSLVPVLLILVSFLFTSFAYAKMFVNQKGEVEIEDQKRELIAEEMEACVTGKEIPVPTFIAEYERMDFFHYIEITKHKEVFVCKDGILSKKINEKPIVVGKEFFAYDVEALLIGLIIFEAGGVLVLKSGCGGFKTFLNKIFDFGWRGLVLLIAVFVACISIIFEFMVVCAMRDVVGVCLCIILVVTFITFIGNEEKNKHIFLMVLYAVFTALAVSADFILG